MTTSYNGWVASPDPTLIHIEPLVVEGASFAPGCRNANYVAVVLGYVATQFHHRVEKLRPGWCWGYYFRLNRNADNLSNHSSGTAIDANAPAHPNGVPTANTFSAKQIAKIHKILAEVDHVVTWGGDYHGTPDSMHFEITTGATRKQVGDVGRKIIAGDVRKVSRVRKAITKVKRYPKPAPGAAVRAALIFRGAPANEDCREVQRVLNAWYRAGLDLDGIYGDHTYAILDKARRGFGIKRPVSNPAARRKTLRKLGLKVL